MDVVIPGDSIRPFCAAIGCLSRMGKELYVDFDPFDGLTLRALNDAKSVFASFHYDPSFFHRCMAPPLALSSKLRTKRKKVKHRNTHAGSGSRKRQRERNGGDTNDNDHEDESDEEEDEEPRLSIRVPIKGLSAVVRKRNHPVVSLRIHTSLTDLHNGDDDDTDTGSNGCYNALSFEFQFQPMVAPRTGNNHHNPPSVVRVVHQIAIADAQAVAAVAPTEGASELVCHPNVLLRMLEPLKGTAEMALIVSDEHKLVSACTFHHDDVVGAVSQQQRLDGPDDANGAATNSHTNNLFFTSKPASLKTETSIGCDDLIDFEYVAHGPSQQADPKDGDDDDDNGMPAPPSIPPPTHVNKQVVLVYNIKEFKALLQFCAHAHSDQELRVSINFFWGGRPMVVETEWEGCFQAQLVMATLDHHLLGAMNQRQAAAVATAAAGGP
jgi:Rad9